MEPRFLSFVLRFPAVHVDQFKSITDNKFHSENIVKLSIDFATVKQNKSMSEWER